MNIIQITREMSANRQLCWYLICTLVNLLDRPVDVDTSPKWKQNGGDFCNTLRNFEWLPEFHLHFKNFLTNSKQLTVEGETNQGTFSTSEKAAMLNDAKIGDSIQQIKQKQQQQQTQQRKPNLIWTFRKDGAPPLERYQLYRQWRTSRQMSLRNFRLTFSIVEESKRPLSLNHAHYSPSSDVLFTTGVSLASTTATGERLHHWSKNSEVKKGKSSKKALGLNEDEMEEFWFANQLGNHQKSLFVQCGLITPCTLVGGPETKTEMFWWVTWRYEEKDPRIYHLAHWNRLQDKKWCQRVQYWKVLQSSTRMAMNDVQ